ncbi:MAG: sugar ABC transporter ATP-binding protein [Lachnospiraceae bacterium]|nr:sugar ABC transporter ATP-binding protein [Lachnospiraceae bacterium]
MKQDVWMRMTDIQKYFPGVHALDGVHFEVKSGEVMALVGENGAGKSTLMKILTGIYQKDEGKILIEGKEVEFANPGMAQKMGISIVHQELNLMGDLTVAENIYIGRESRKGIVLQKGEQNAKAKALLDSLNLDIKPNEIVKKLTVAKQQMVEIAKALSFENTKLLILDEPSAALTDTEIQELFRFIRDMKERGVGIVYISHRMDELLEITDRITVMRDGQYVGLLNTAETTMDEIVSMMVGRVIYEDPKTASRVSPDSEVILEAKHLCSREVKDVSFALRKGEILGFAGLMGAGRTETARLVCGADKKDSGEVFVKGQKVDIRKPEDAVKHGIGYLSEDRKRYGLCLGLSVTENIALPSLQQVTGAVINKEKLNKIAADYVKQLQIKTPGVNTVVRSLSGGNQQKVVIAKWLLRDCDVLIFDEPTRGIDVGAKSEIYKLMNELADEGKSIIMISSELPELLRMSDRIIVMCEGKVTGEIDIAEASQENIMQLATSR